MTTSESGRPSIVIIGAGSVSFGLTLLGDLFAAAETLRGSTVWLVDCNAQTLELIARYAEKVNLALGAPFDIRATTDRCQALPGAAFVVLSVAVDRLETWKLDWQIPLRHGVRHVLGENGGPGGLSHALRSIPLALAIARDIERLAPNALVLNFTNPMSRVCMALDRHTCLRVVGLCHQINEGYRLVNRALKLVPETGDPDADVRAVRARVRLIAAGLNHFSFILDVRDAHTGADLYPLLRERLRQMPPDFALLSRRLMEVFGLFCASGDLHAGEYVGFAAETLPLTGYDFDAYARWGQQRLRRLRQIVESPEPPDLAEVATPSLERAVPIIQAVIHGAPQYEESLNLRNEGCISNLPAQAIVELPGVVSAAGARGVHVGALPEGLAAVMRREVDIQALVVQAAVYGDRSAALQALLLDPHIHSYAQATHLLDDLLRAHARYLPQFA
ncbi:MAG: hypothetical protein NZ693_12405 [Thermoflexales bacterium]|nr:hypothetical protein [Thermoflexales bacterium]